MNRACRSGIGIMRARYGRVRVHANVRNAWKADRVSRGGKPTAFGQFWLPDAGAAMQMFEYVIVLISIVMGLALTHLMQGVAGLIQNPERARIWWVHLVWVAYMFLSVIFWWWYEFQLQHIKTWSFATYLFVVFYAFYLYLICAVLFPRDLGGREGYKEYFLARRGWFFGLLIGWSIIDTIDTWIKGPDYFASLGLTAMTFNAVLILCSVVGIVARRGWIQATIAVGQLVYVLRQAILIG